MRKILVVDDEAQIRNLLKKFLEAKDYTVITAVGGKEAVEKTKENPDLVLLDIQMPDMDGLQALKKIKEENPSIGVVMVTGTAEQDVAIACTKNGAHDYVTKPIDLDHLETVIEVYMIQATEEEPAGDIESLIDDTAPEAIEEHAEEKKEKIKIPDISKVIERRKCRRFKIPLASGKVKKTGLLFILKGFSKTYPVMDISKGGLSFTCHESLKVNQKIIFQLLVPQEPALNFRAIIQRVGHLDEKGDRIYVVQFMTFGMGSNQNPVDALNVLRRLYQQYGG